MRLLQRKSDGTLVLTTFPDGDPPPFAILSHTWGKDQDEIVYKDIDPDRNGNFEAQIGLKRKLGYRKVDFCLSQAARDGLQYVWIDTCCINKDSQVELGRAINWMYRWYALAQVCYVYLSDVSKHVSETFEDSVPRWHSEFRKSRWFTRGWTLQELIAPSHLIFFSKHGDYLGDKGEMAGTIESVTGIPLSILRGHAALSSFTVQERFNWATNRQTTEAEDRVYSMFGILGVSFTPNYGEGELPALQHLRAALLEAYRGELLILDFGRGPQTSDRLMNIVSVKTVEEHRAKAGLEWLQNVTKALEFDQRDLRRMNISKPTGKTCEWLLHNTLYRRWAQRSDQTHGGLLWIKGKPGAGKSTLMKFADSQAVMSSSSRDLVISFYFNARGAKLEKSVEGVYRSLLCQLIASVEPTELSGLADTLRPYKVPGPDLPWSIDTLQIFLTAMANMLRDRRLTIFIDALDECREDDVREMLYFLEELGHSAVENGRGHQTLMCFASRYYPTLVLPTALELKLEDEAEHTRDLETHVTKALRVGSDARAQAIKTKLLAKANGVFIWAVLVIKILNTDYAHGLVLGLEKRLDGLPADMSRLAQEIVKQEGVPNDDFVLALQWILFAEEPMTSKLFYYAMMAGGTDESQWYRSDTDGISDTDTERLVSHYTKGLAELTSKGGTFQIQFIHETVPDFLVRDGGLDALWPSEHISSDERLKSICERHLDFYIKSTQRRSSSSKRDEFLVYAADQIIYHAERAAFHHSQEHFLRTHKAAYWHDVEKLVGDASKKRWYSSAGLLHLLVQRDAIMLLKTAVGAGIESLETRDKATGYSPLLQACADGRHSAALVLLETGADVRKRDLYGNTALMLACERRRVEIVKLLLDFGADLEWRDPDGRTALLVAYRNNSTEIVELLLDRGAYVDAKDPYGYTLLMSACRGLEQDFVDLLLKRGAHIEAENSHGDTPLLVASRHDRDDIARLLLIRGADIEARDSAGHTPLAVACTSYYQEKCLKVLLEFGADIEALNNRGETPLMLACKAQSHARVRLLLDTGANINAVDANGNTALMLAVCAGWHVGEIVSTLLANMDDIDAVNVNGDTALSIAEQRGRSEDIEKLRIRQMQKRLAARNSAPEQRSQIDHRDSGQRQNKHLERRTLRPWNRSINRLSEIFTKAKRVGK